MQVKDIIKHWKRRPKAVAIREYCKECAGGSSSEVTVCTVLNCPLWGYRFGTSPTNGTFKKRMEDWEKRNEQEFNEAYQHLADGQDNE